MLRLPAFLFFFMLFEIAGSDKTCRFICKQKVKVVWKNCRVIGEEDCHIIYHPGMDYVTRLEFNRLTASVLDIRKFSNVQSVVIHQPTEAQIQRPCRYVWAKGPVQINGNQCDVSYAPHPSLPKSDSELMKISV